MLLYFLWVSRSTWSRTCSWWWWWWWWRPRSGFQAHCPPSATFSQASHTNFVGHTCTLRSSSSWKKIVMILMGLWLCVLCMCTKERHYDYLVYVVAYCSPHLLYTKNSSKWLLWWHPLDVCQLVTVPSSRAWSSQRYRGRCYNWIHNNFAINVLLVLPGSPNGWKTGAQPWASPPVQLWPTSRSSPVLMVIGW